MHNFQAIREEGTDKFGQDGKRATQEGIRKYYRKHKTKWHE